VLVSLVLVPLVLGLVQVALVLHVRNTLTAAASEGARYAATVDRSPEDGVARTRTQITGAIADRFAGEISAANVVVDGVPAVEVRVRATVPALGLWGPGVELEVAGHAVREVVPGAVP
jgi:Flp pilus assembly protein TadG